MSNTSAGPCSQFLFLLAALSRYDHDVPTCRFHFQPDEHRTIRISPMGDADGTGFDFERSMEMAAPRGALSQVRAAPSASNVGPTWNNDAQALPHQSGGGGPVFAPAKRNYRQTVCRHWLRSLCMKGDQCGFLHQYDKSRMPVCRFFAKWGECREPDCPYKHTLEDIKECNMYVETHLVSVQ